VPRSRMTSKGQITIPKEVRERLGVEPGDVLEFTYVGNRLEVTAIRRKRVQEFRGLFQITRALPFSKERKQAWTAQVRRLSRRGTGGHA
jgi:antitoxin PrlF